MKIKTKQILFLICMLAAVVAAVVIFLNKNKSELYSSDYKESERQDIVEYGGKQYKYNDHLSNYLFIGVDTRDEITSYETQTDAGQADTIYLLSYDRVKCTLTCVAIPRDTLTRIQIYSADGTDMGTTVDHINIQYAFGDGKTKSCQLMKDAVSNMMYGIPIQGYYSMNMDGIPVAAGVLGDVEVVVPDDSWAQLNDNYQKGTTVTLTEENAELLVRYRDTTETQSAIERMNRQKVILKAIATNAKDKTSEDTDFIVEMQEALKPYMVTNMGNDVLAKLAEAKFDTESGIIDIPGEGVEGADFDEYHIDEKELYELVLELFYEEM